MAPMSMGVGWSASPQPETYLQIPPLPASIPVVRTVLPLPAAMAFMDDRPSGAAAAAAPSVRPETDGSVSSDLSHKELLEEIYSDAEDARQPRSPPLSSPAAPGPHAV